MKKYRMLSHSYRLVSHTVSTKDVILNKKSSASLTTEQFLKIDQQPSNTCPMINPVQELIESQMKPLAKICDISLICLNGRECPDCSNSEIYNSNLNLARESQCEAETYKNQLKDASEYLEILRTDCEDLRAHGLEIKSLIWSIPEVDDLEKLREKILEFIENPPDSKFSSKKYYSYFPDGDKVSSFSVENFNSCENENCFFHRRMLNEIEEIAEKLLPSNTISEEDCSDAMDNYEKISEWVGYLGDKALELIDDPEAVQKMKDKNDINAFVVEYQKDFDKNYNLCWSFIKKGDLITKLAKKESEVKELLIDFDENDSLECLIVKEIFSKLKDYSLLVDDISLENNLEEHKKITRKAFDEILPKIDAVIEIVIPASRDYKLQGSNPEVYHYYRSLAQTCSSLKNFTLLISTYAHHSFFVEEHLT